MQSLELEDLELETKQSLKIVSVNIQKKYKETIKLIVDAGMYPSTSEFVRSALSNFIRIYLIYKGKLNNEKNIPSDFNILEEVAKIDSQLQGLPL